MGLVSWLTKIEAQALLLLPLFDIISKRKKFEYYKSRWQKKRR